MWHNIISRFIIACLVLMCSFTSAQAQCSCTYAGSNCSDQGCNIPNFLICFFTGGTWNDPSACPLLPIELSNFTSEQFKGSTRLHWSTENEVENEGFFVERSVDFIQWKDLAFIPGSGNSTQRKEYHYVDSEVSPYIERYYRLRQIDFNGDENLSKVIHVDATELPDGIITFPNPVIDQISVAIPEQQRTYFNVLEIFSSPGQLLLSNKISSEGPLRLDLSEFPQGIYAIRLRGEQHHTTATFVKR